MFPRATPTLAHAIRRSLLAAALLVLQLVSPALALGALANTATVICRAEGRTDGQAPPGPDHHPGCVLCPAHAAPAPLLASPAVFPAPRMTAVAAPALPVADQPARARRVLAQPRGPPAV